MNRKYTKEQWCDEMQYNFRPDAFCDKHEKVPGSLCNLPCPDCGALGYYGPKLQVAGDLMEYGMQPNEPDFVFASFILDGKQHTLKHRITRKYRCCKWCGLLQEAWGRVLDDDPLKGNSHKACLRRHKKCGKGIEPNWATFSPEGVSCKDCGENIEQFVPKDDPSFKQTKEIMDKIHQDIQHISNQ